MRKIKTLAEFFDLELPSFKPAADVWESLIAAVMLDGGLKAVLNTFGKIMAPFLVYFVFELSVVLNYYE